MKYTSRYGGYTITADSSGVLITDDFLDTEIYLQGEDASEFLDAVDDAYDNDTSIDEICFKYEELCG